MVCGSLGSDFKELKRAKLDLLLTWIWYKIAEKVKGKWEEQREDTLRHRT